MNDVLEILSLNPNQRWILYASDGEHEIPEGEFYKALPFDLPFEISGIRSRSCSIRYFRGMPEDVDGLRYDVVIAPLCACKIDDLGRLLHVCRVKSSLILFPSAAEQSIRAQAKLTCVDCVFWNGVVGVVPKFYFLGKVASYYYSHKAIRDERFEGVVPVEEYLSLFSGEQVRQKCKSSERVVEQVKNNIVKHAERKFINPEMSFCIVCGDALESKGLHFVAERYTESYFIGEEYGIGRQRTGNVPAYYVRDLYDQGRRRFKYCHSDLTENGAFEFYGLNIGRYIPSFEGVSTFSCFFIAKPGTFEDHDVIELINYFDSALDSLVLQDFRKRLLVKSMVTAISSIMSRNGSHNIGSHVLSALSHNIGTMPDDRVLYQYIQHRMDYIATVTTDFPAWSQPTMFVGGMIKNFLTQRHLLNHIAGSEGLKAWQYQNQNIGTQSACIRLHVRRIKGDVCDENRKVVADFFADSVSAIKLEQDVCLAIPGGVVGQHAFFTIIENLIRNAAKHDWSTPPESTKEFKYQRRKQRRKLGDADSDADAMDLRGHPDTEIYETESVDGREVLKVVGNLDVYIDFEDKPEEGNVEFTVYTNMSDAEVAPGSGGQSLVQSIQASLDEPIIDNETGMLRRTNWGLAEMKISCGYLQGREIGEIGGLAGKSDRADKNEERFGPILTACAVKINREDTVKHLGYRFKVPKPRTLLLITQNEVAPETKKKFPKLAEYGVYVKSMCRQSDKNVGAVNKEELGAEFVLLDSFETECYSWKLPFRVIAMKEDASEPQNLIAKWNYDGGASSEILARKTTVDKVIDFVANGDDEHGDMESRTKEVIAHVAACWTRYVCKRRCPNLDSEQKVNLVVVPTAKSGSGEHGAGRSLVTPVSVASYVFEEGFDTAVSSYEHLHGIDSGSSGEKAVCYSVLEHLRKLKPRVVTAEYRKSDWGYEEVVQRQLVDWLKNLKADNVECREVADYLELKLKEKSQEDLKDIKRSLEEVVARIDAGERSPDLLAKKKSLIFKRNELIGRAHETAREAHHYFATFVAYFIEVCKQAKVYLGKYAEDVATVPQSFKNLNSIGGKDREEGASHRWEAGGLTFYRTEQVESRAEDVTIEYIRHFTESEGVVREPGTEPKFVTNPFYAHPGVKYIEALSGTQSYLSQLQMMRYDDYVMQTKLMENALLRILIIDERVAKFIGDHSDVMLATYSRLNLTVVDDKWMEDALKSDENNCVMGRTPRGLLTLNVAAIKALNKELLKPEHEELEDFKHAFDQGGSDWLVKSYSKQFDILIVHQGIIDKWFPDVAHDPNRVTCLYWAMKKLFPYVIITTGRGTPANIPNWARVLPFSTIESTLFKKYPEKLLLVDAIMNILPLSKS